VSPNGDSADSGAPRRPCSSYTVWEKVLHDPTFLFARARAACLSRRERSLLVLGAALTRLDFLEAALALNVLPTALRGGQRVASRVVDGADAVAGALADAGRHARRAQQATRIYVRRAPFSALGLAVAVGAALTFVLTRRRG
jgi:hypothetical protein